MSSDYLTDLNKEQRRAVKHGIDSESATKSPPLLVIAGAGSGKTKTLAHRVAHLVVSGVDPHRILLLTFTRRAADEMIRRVKRITAKVLGIQQVDLPWSGTFHAIGARLLREYATQIGLKPSFTILDRSDAADLMDLVRHDLGQSRKASPVPQEGHLFEHLFVRHQFGEVAGAGPCKKFPLVWGMGGRSAPPVPVIYGS